MDDKDFLFELGRVEDKLMAYAMALTRYSVDDARELFQATVVRAYIKRELFAPGRRFGFWIGRIMKNVYLNEFVSVRCREFIPNDGVLSDSLDFLLYTSCIEDTLELSEVCSLIGRIPSEVSLPLIMYAHGYKYCEIADALNIPIGSVKRRINTARKHLRRLLNE
ncbi:MAG: RNA polymerase sigma factor [Bacteroidaceae bacterium]|nr:RNA polymerase sigma factor [Bacteroidaceae bacterium]